MGRFLHYVGHPNAQTIGHNGDEITVRRGDVVEVPPGIARELLDDPDNWRPATPEQRESAEEPG